MKWRIFHRQKRRKLNKNDLERQHFAAQMDAVFKAMMVLPSSPTEVVIPTNLAKHFLKTVTILEINDPLKPRYRPLTDSEIDGWIKE